MELEPGEPPAGPWQAVHLTDVVQRLRRASAAAVDRPRVVAVDGRGGAGKSTLVEALAAHVPGSVVVHTDDIAWHHAFFDWGDLLVTHVLEPVHRGEAVDHRPRAWQERGRPGSVVVPAGVDTVWVEGTGVVREQLRPWLDASVWVQVDRGEAERRLRARDGTSPEQVQLVADWALEEHPFLRREQPWAHATLVVAGSPVLPDLARDELAVAGPAGG